MSLPLATRCPVCGDAASVPVVHVGGLPALCNAFAATQEEARSMPRGDIDLVDCRTCGMLRNRAFDPSLAPYDSEYENSLHFSEHFRGFAAELARDLAARHGVAGGTVVEIGSGRGDFLTMLAAQGFATAVGLDPSLSAVRETVAGAATVQIVPGTVEDAPPGLLADLLVCRHVLEHLDDPVGVLWAARTGLARPGTALYVEVPDATHMLAAPAVWDLIYEHAGYFTANALLTALAAAGWVVTGHGTSFGGQYLWAEAVAPTASDVVADDRREAEHDDGLAAGFASVHRASRERWREFLAEAATAGRRVAVWGAGSKGVTFVNAFASFELAAVDASPRKHGRFIPGTGTPIEPPDGLAGRADTVLVMNPLYLDEIRRTGKKLGVEAEYLAVDA